MTMKREFVYTRNLLMYINWQYHCCFYFNLYDCGCIEDNYPSDSTDMSVSCEDCTDVFNKVSLSFFIPSYIVGIILLSLMIPFHFRKARKFIIDEFWDDIKDKGETIRNFRILQQNQ